MCKMTRFQVLKFSKSLSQFVSHFGIDLQLLDLTTKLWVQIVKEYDRRVVFQANFYGRQLWK